jgi:hypothetical protein
MSVIDFGAEGLSASAWVPTQKPVKFNAADSARHVLDILAALPWMNVVLGDPDVSLVGTMYTHGEGNDYDYVVLVHDVVRAKVELESAGYTQTGEDEYEDDEFTTFRKGVVNIMLTQNEEFFKQFKVAAEVTKYVQSILPDFAPGVALTREHHVKIHRIIMNWEEAE